jgi:hypothetical protein
MYQKNLKLLYRSFDQKLKPAEQKRLEQALQTSDELHKVKQDLESLRREISGIQHPPARPFLAERVLNRIRFSDRKASAEERFWETLFYSFRKVAVVTAITVLIVLGFYLANEEVVFADHEVEIEDLLETDTFIAME